MLKDYRQLEKIIEPQKWDVLIRIIDNTDAMSMTRGSGSQVSTGVQRMAASSVTAQELRLAAPSVVLSALLSAVLSALISAVLSAGL